MYAIKVWDKGSTNFGANKFVEKNGTEIITKDTLKEALSMIFALSSIKSIEKLILDCPEGRLEWKKNVSEDEYYDDLSDDLNDGLI